MSHIDDEVLEEFENTDLGEAIKKSGVKHVIHGKKTKHPTSIALDQKLIDELKEKGSKRGIGYQTMMRIIIMENISKY